MDNQLIEARKGNLTNAMKAVAGQEGIEGEALRDLVAAGKAVILSNDRHRNLTPKGVGAGLSVKVNANIGTSSERVHIEEEIEKLRVAEEAGTDAVMDLSTGGALDEIRKIVMSHAHVPVGTVPIYRRRSRRWRKRAASRLWSPTNSSR